MNDLFFELLKQAFRIGFRLGHQTEQQTGVFGNFPDETESPCEIALNDFLKQHFGDGKLFPERRSKRRE